MGYRNAAWRARQAIVRANRFSDLLKTHTQRWDRLWRRCDIVIKDGSESQLILRLHLFHLLQTVSPNSIDLDVGIPARGLNGEAYRGHVFWDELFIFSLLNLRIPDITQSLLLYRYRALGPSTMECSEKRGFMVLCTRGKAAAMDEKKAKLCI